MRVKSITFQFQKSWQKHKGLRSKFLGVSRAEIRTILNIDKSNHRRNAKFLNKAKLTPIRARDVHVRHQIDLMDMSRKGYDLQKIGQDGVKRAKQLPLYQRILNNDPKEVITKHHLKYTLYEIVTPSERADYKKKSFLVLGGFAQLRITILLEVAIANLLHYCTRQREWAF